MPTALFKGSCLCGTVQYEVTGTPLNFFHCHCQRCRKANGTGHASNIIVDPESAEWLCGETALQSYKVPEAKRFRNVFCKDCGSPMPRIAPDLSIAVIPAGTLDVEAAIPPTARIFWDDRTEWSCAAGDLPCWPNYPEPGA